MKSRILVTAFAMTLPIFGAFAPTPVQASDRGDVAGALLGGIALGVIASKLLDDDKDRHRGSYNGHRKHRSHKHQAQRHHYKDRHYKRGHSYNGYHGNHHSYSGIRDQDRR